MTVGTLGVLFYLAKKEKTPGAQLPHDPEKKTLVVLGSGWGATSLLKSLDTTDYNVVRHLCSLWLHDISQAAGRL